MLDAYNLYRIASLAEANSVIAEAQAELSGIIAGKLLHVSALCQCERDSPRSNP